MLWVIQFSTMNEDRILRCSFNQFRSLYDTCERLDAAEKRLNAWTMLIASQASGKDMTKWVKMWDAVIEGRDTDAAKLMERFGSGM